MLQNTVKATSPLGKSKVLKVILLVAVCAYFVYVLYWFIKTIPWIAQISFDPASFYPAAGLSLVNPLAVPSSYLMEYVGFAGLAVRLVGACCALAAAVLVIRGYAFSSAKLKSYASKAILLEGFHFFSFIPAFYYLAAVSTLPVTSRACLSGQLAVQLALIAPSLIILGLKLRKPTVSLGELTKYAAFATVFYVLALWVSYWLKWTEMTALEGLPFLFMVPRVVAFLNTAIVFSLAAAFAVLGARSVLQKQSSSVASRWWGLAAILLSTHLTIFVVFCVSVNAAFLAVFGELWTIPLMALGAYLLAVSVRKSAEAS